MLMMGVVFLCKYFFKSGEEYELWIGIGGIIAFIIMASVLT
jgi:hypothetical protein